MKFLNIKKSNKIYILLLILLTYVLINSLSHINYLTFDVLNGDFQNYNTLKRLFDGDFIGKDFNSYLGTSNVFFLYIFYLINAEDGFVWSIFISFFVTQIIFISMCLIVFHLYRIKFKVALILSFIFYYISVNFSVYSPDQMSLMNILHANNSLYGLRMFLPFFITFLLLLIIPKDLILTKKLKLIIPILLGISLTWSNDFSIPTYLTSIGLYAILISKTTNSFLKEIIKFILISILSYIIIILMITDFNFFKYMKYNFIVIPSEQYWYYLGEVLFDINNLPINIYVILIIVIGGKCLYKPTRNSYLILFLLVSSLFASYLTQIGGRISDRYFTNIYFLSILLIIAELYNVFIKFFQKINFFPSSFFYNIIFIILIFIPFYESYNLIIQDKKNLYYYEPKMKTNIDEFYRESFLLADKLEINKLKEDDFFNEYTSLIDDLLKTKNNSGNDFIIHALGEEERHKYLNSFFNNPKYISTIREDFNPWSLWSKRTNWWFFKELFKSSYVPKYATGYSIIWSQDIEKARVIEKTNLLCNIKKLKENSTILSFEGMDNLDDFIANVKIKFDVQLEENIIPLIGKRFLLEVDDNSIKYRLNPYSNEANLLFQYTSNRRNELLIDSKPFERSKLDIKECSVEILRFYNEKNEIKKINQTKVFIPQNYNDENWNKGIYLKGKNGFFMIKTAFNNSFSIGDKLEFNSGIRKITNIEYNSKFVNIYVDGNNLSPLLDGYPNEIKLIEKE
jgi:hypothetical protein